MRESKKELYFFIGTVAEFNKLTPVFKELQKRKILFKIINSGQNQINYADFKNYLGDIKSYLIINQKANKSSIIIFLSWALVTFIKSLIILWREFKNLDKKNSYFIVHGDTVTSTIGAFVAKILRLKLVHIEAGYFSGNFLEPFPEEICKHINSYLANILFAPTDWALENIKKFKGEKISTNYNTNIDSFWWAMRQKTKPLKNMNRKFYLLIVHRQEHVMFRKKWTKEIMEFVIRNSNKGLDCVLLNHPLTSEIIKSLNLGSRSRSIKMISLISYPEFLHLFKQAEYVATDSATMQQEAFYMGKPYLGLADFSVQTEGLTKNAVLSKSNEKVIKNFLKNYKQYNASPIKPKVSPSKIIVDFLLR